MLLCFFESMSSFCILRSVKSATYFKFMEDFQCQDILFNMIWEFTGQDENSGGKMGKDIEEKMGNGFGENSSCTCMKCSNNKMKGKWLMKLLSDLILTTTLKVGDIKPPQLCRFSHILHPDFPSPFSYQSSTTIPSHTDPPLLCFLSEKGKTPRDIN